MSTGHQGSKSLEMRSLYLMREHDIYNLQQILLVLKTESFNYISLDIRGRENVVNIERN